MPRPCFLMKVFSINTVIGFYPLLLRYIIGIVIYRKVIHIMKVTDLKENEKCENLDLKGLHIIQNTELFCFGIDAVLLAWYASRFVHLKTKVLEVGTGTGIIPLLLVGHDRTKNMEAVEVQAVMADMARRSVALNGLEDQITVREGDIRSKALDLNYQHYDVIICNPPYMKKTHGKHAEGSSRAVSRHEVMMTVEDLANFSKKYLKDKGKLILIHRADRLGDVVTALRQADIEIKKLRFVHPYVHKQANLVLIEAVKKGNAFLQVEPPLIIYDSQGNYTELINRIYEEEKYGKAWG